MKLNLPINIVKLSNELQDGGYAFEAVVLSGEPIDSWYQPFVIDLSTMKYHKPRLTVNYNHNDNLIIGYGENFHITPDGLKSTGKLAAGSFADEIVNLARQGVPFEASVEIDLHQANETRVGADAEITANGQTYKGPISLYKDVPMRGYAICPLGADKFTNLTLLAKEKDYLMTKRKLTTKLSEAEKDDAAEKPDDAASSVKSPELEELCSIFGKENGVALFQSGADIEEVKQWQELNEKYSKYLSDDPVEEVKEEATTPEPKEEEKLSSKALTKLADMLATQSAEIVKLKAAMLAGGAEPVSGNKERNTQLSAKEAYQQSITKAIKKQ